MALDPRLSSVELLALAALRVKQRAATALDQVVVLQIEYDAYVAEPPCWASGMCSRCRGKPRLSKRGISQWPALPGSGAAAVRALELAPPVPRLWTFLCHDWLGLDPSLARAWWYALGHAHWSQSAQWRDQFVQFDRQSGTVTRITWSRSFPRWRHSPNSCSWWSS